MQGPSFLETKSEHALRKDAMPERAGLLRFSAFHLLAALVLLIVAAPFFEEFSYGNQVESILFTIVLILAVLTVGGRRRDLVISIILVIPVLALKWAHHHLPNLVPPEGFRIGAMIFLAFVASQMLRFVLQSPKVSAEVISTAISAYLVMGIIWGLGYMVAGELIPNSFTFQDGTTTKTSMVGFNAIYFSFVTLSTVGYGDIVPVSKVARMLAMTEAMTGVFYVAILISRLVALYVPRRSQDNS